MTHRGIPVGQGGRFGLVKPGMRPYGSQTPNAFHKTLEEFDRVYTEWYDPRRNLTRLRMLKGHPASIHDVIDMIEILLRQYQTSFDLHPTDPWTIYLPYMFVEPQVGDQIYNITQEVMYTVATVHEDPLIGDWDHYVRLSGPSGKNPARHDRLMLQTEDRYVRLPIAYPTRAARTQTSNEGEIGTGEGESWVPTITARVTRREPESLGRTPFSDSKRLGPSRFEIFRDPKDRHRHSIEITRQGFDNLLRFDCWDHNPLGTMRLVNWFENFMEIYTGVLIENGVPMLLYWDRRDNTATERWRDDILAQTVRYFVRTERLRAKRLRNLTRMHLRVRTITSPTDSGGSLNTGQCLWFGRTHDDTGGYKYGTFVFEDHGQTGEHDLPADPESYLSDAGYNQYDDGC